MHRNRPYGAVVRDLIAGRGVGTDHLATNFVSVTYDPDRKAYDPERLAARVARAFLGVRIDGAQCHDHPFQPWKRADFQGLAAYFGQVEPSITGITDDHKAVEAAYLATLTRRPTPEESAHFEARLAETRGAPRKEGMTDLLWVLLNSTEFSYNH